jgi:hypothetical protein
VSRLVEDSTEGGYGLELVFVEHGSYQVRVPVAHDGRVQADYVRIIDLTDDQREVAYWNLEEIAADIKRSDEDPTTAFNAILSAIEVVRTGKFPPEGF